MISKVLEGALAGDNSLDEESEHGEHGESAVFDLLNLELSKSIGVVSKAQGVEGATGVEGVETLRPLEATTVVTVALNGTHEDNLNDEGSDNAVGVHEAGETEVVNAFLSEDLGTSVEPGNVSSVGGPLGHEAAEGTEHSPASMDDLDLAVPGKSLGVSGETGSVPAVVSGVLTLEVRHVGREGAKELGAASTVPENT